MKNATFALAVLLTMTLPADAQIVRHLSPPASQPAVILDAVTVPAAAETLYLSGQVAAPIHQVAAGRGMTAADLGNTEIQTVSILRRIETALGARGYAMSDVIKLTVFIVADPSTPGRMDFAGFNRGYRRFFGTVDNPNLVARSTVQVAALAHPAYLVEIEATAAMVR